MSILDGIERTISLVGQAGGVVNDYRRDRYAMDWQASTQKLHTLVHPDLTDDDPNAEPGKSESNNMPIYVGAALAVVALVVLARRG